MLVYTIFILSIVKCLLIKHRASNKYLAPVSESGYTFVRLTDNKTAAFDVIMEPLKDGFVSLKDSKNPEKTFDIADNKTNLILYDYHGGMNQQFLVTMKGSGEYNIINKNLCLEHDPTSFNILLKPCNNSENQIFEFLSPSKNNDVQDLSKSTTTVKRLLNDGSNILYDFSSNEAPRILKAHRSSNSRVIHHHYHHPASQNIG